MTNDGVMSEGDINLLAALCATESAPAVPDSVRDWNGFPICDCWECGECDPLVGACARLGHAVNLGEIHADCPLPKHAGAELAKMRREKWRAERGW